jgi:hypothetical protein
MRALRGRSLPSYRRPPFPSNSDYPVGVGARPPDDTTEAIARTADARHGADAGDGADSGVFVQPLALGLGALLVRRRE